VTLDVRFHPEALAEFRADLAWYEGRGAGLGDRIEATVDDVIDTVLEWPERPAPSDPQRPNRKGRSQTGSIGPTFRGLRPAWGVAGTA
jgi:hypothetical protein